MSAVDDVIGERHQRDSIAGRLPHMPSLARLLQLAQQLSFLYVIVRIGRELWLFGLVPTLKRIFLATLKAAPGGQRLLNSQIDNEARTAVAQLLATKGFATLFDPS